MILIYTLSSTRNIDDIRNVGKTTQKLKRRLQQHLTDAKHAKLIGYTHNHNYNWINQELSEGYEIKIIELDMLDVDNKDDWEWLEQYWICQMKVWGFNLNNLTLGGDGNKGQIFSKEAIEKRANKIRGIPRPQEVKDAISKSHTGINLSEEHKQHVRESIIKLQGKSIKQYDTNGNFIKEWEYIKKAADYYNLEASNIIKCCNRIKNHATCGGFIWRYSDDETPVLFNFKKKVLLQCDLDGNVIKEWATATQAAKELNISASSISCCCSGKQKSYKNYIWKFNK